MTGCPFPPDDLTDLPQSAARQARKPPESNRRYLQRRSQPAHALAEKTWVTPTGFVDLDHYRRWLSALLGVHQSIGLAANAECGPGDNEEQQRIFAICADLSCGAPSPDPTLTVSQDWAWGACYALNGSALGASILLKTNAIAPSWPTQYLQHMRNYVKSGQLAKFFRSLNQQELNQENAVDGAFAVFNAIEAYGRSSQTKLRDLNRP